MDELFDLPPSEFIAARNALAKELRAGGDKDAAAEVKALRRPTVGAWAVNQVARQQAELVREVVGAGQAVAAALDAGDRDALRQATVRRRDAVLAATRAAVALAGDAHRDDIADTFEAAAGDAEAAAAVLAGRLAQGLQPTSVFAPLGDAPMAKAKPKPKQDDAALKDARRRAQEADARVAALRDDLRAAEHEAKQAWEEVDRLGPN